MHKYILLISLLSVGCEQTFNLTPTAPSGTTNITNTNTNTNTNNNNDKTGSDTGPTKPSDPTVPGAVIPLPAYGENVVQQIGSNNPSLLANSCQTQFGEVAWRFLDLVISTLQLQDSRWGYLCKDETCNTIAKDIVAYRASSGNTGIWIVDVIGNHCPGPSDTVSVTWQVLPFETQRKWTSHR